MKVEIFPFTFASYSNPLIDFQILKVVHYGLYMKQKDINTTEKMEITMYGQVDCSTTDIADFGIKIIQSEADTYNLQLFYNGKPKCIDAKYYSPVYKPFTFVFSVPYSTTRTWKLILQHIIDGRKQVRTIQYIRYVDENFYLCSKSGNTDIITNNTAEELYSKGKNITREELKYDRSGCGKRDVGKQVRKFGLVPIDRPPFLEDGAKIVPFSSFSTTTLHDDGNLHGIRLYYQPMSKPFSSVFSQNNVKEHHAHGILVSVKKTDDNLVLCVFNGVLIGYIPHLHLNNHTNDGYANGWKETTVFIQDINEVSVQNSPKWSDPYLQFKNSPMYPYF